MSSQVDDALDRLASIGWLSPEEAQDLATVREALERLRANQRTGRIIHGDATADAWSERAFDQQKARAEAAEAEVRRLTEGLREQGEPIMDERFRDRLLRHVLSNEEVSQLVDAIESREARAHALLSASPSDGPDDFCEHGYTTENAAHPSAGLERCPTCSPSDGGGA